MNISDTFISEIKMKRENIKSLQPLADCLSAISLMAKDFAEAMTCVNVQAKNLQGKTTVRKEYAENNAAVRRMLLQRGIVL